jgi:hypothetical protein
VNKILLICSHLESGSDLVVENLDSGSKLRKLNASYSTLNCLFLNKKNTVYNKRPKVYFDHILYNHEFSCKELYKHVNFVYIIGNPKKTITNIVYDNVYNEKTALNYYCFRIRRIYEMIKRSKNCICFFDEEIYNSEIYNKIHKMLGIKDNLKIKTKTKEKKETKINKKILDEAEEFYEKYRYYIKNQTSSQP